MERISALGEHAFVLRARWRFRYPDPADPRSAELPGRTLWGAAI